MNNAVDQDLCINLESGWKMNVREDIVCSFLRKISPNRDWEYLGEHEHAMIADLVDDIAATLESSTLTAEQVELRSNDGADSREKLEADVRRFVRLLPTTDDERRYCEVIDLLDRQAAITERALQTKADELKSEIVSLMQKKQPYTFNPEDLIENIKTLCRYIDELTDERDRWREKCTEG